MTCVRSRRCCAVCAVPVAAALARGALSCMCSLPENKRGALSHSQSDNASVAARGVISSGGARDGPSQSLDVPLVPRVPRPMPDGYG